MKNKTILFLSILVCNLGLSQEKNNHFSLEEAVNHALIHNRNIKNADLNIKAAQYQKWETIATGLPQINAKIDYSTQIESPFDFSDNQEDQENSMFGFFFPKQNVTPNITLSQLVFDGAYLVGLRSVKLFLEISKNAKEKTKKEIKTTVINTYARTLLSKENIRIMNQNVEAVQNNLNETIVIFKNGLTEEENVEQLELTLSNLKNNLNNLRNIQEVSKGFLKLLLGIDLEEPIELTESLNDIVKKYLSLDPIKSGHAVFNNIDYMIAKNNSQSKYLLYKLEKSKKLPSISAFLNSSYMGYADNFSSIFTKEQEWMSSTVVGASIKIPVFTSFGGRAMTQRAKINWKMSLNNLKETENNLRLEIQKLKNECTLAIDTYYNKQKNLKLAERIEQKNTLKYREGISSSFELRQAQMQLYKSQQEYLESMIYLIDKKTALENILNTKL